MSTKPTTASKGRGRLRSFFVLLVILAVLFFGLAYFLSSRLDAAKAQYQGAPLEVAEYLHKKAPEPNGWDAVEATQLLLEGQRGLRPAVAGDTRESNPDVTDLVARTRRIERDGGRPTAEDIAKFKEALGRLEPALMVLDQGLATATEARYFGKNDGLPVEIEIPNLLGTLRIASILRARGEVAIAEGRLADAWQDAGRIYRYAYWHSTTMNALINGLVARAVARQADGLVQALVAQGPIDEVAAAAAMAEAKKIDPGPLFTKLLQAERAAMFTTLTAPQALPASLLGDAPTARIANWRPFRDYNAARFLEWSLEADKICMQPAYLRVDGKEKIAQLAIPSWITPANTLTFDCTDVANKRDLWLASNDMREIVFALATYKETQGRYPATLAEAGKELEAKIDPFSGKSYIYVPEGEGYRLYSLSVNLKNDGGKQVFKKDDTPDLDNGDWLFAIQPPAEGATATTQ